MLDKTPENFDTIRLLLCRPSKEDGNVLRHLWRDKKVREFLGGTVLDDAIDEKIASIQAHWEKHKFGLWTVFEKTLNKIIGICGLHHSDDGIEISYMFFPEFWGKGLATEAAIATLNFGFKVLKLDKIIAITQEANIGSCRLLSNIGMRHIDNFRRFDANQALYEITKISEEDFKAIQETSYLQSIPNLVEDINEGMGEPKENLKTRDDLPW